MSAQPIAPANLCKTGIEGLDDILRGGLPRNRLYLIKGEPGVGKTTLAMQFLLEGQKLGEKGLYITLSETNAELDEVAKSHGWDFSKITLFELSALEAQIQGDTDTTFFGPSEVALSRATKALLDEVDRAKPMRVVFDSLSELRLMSETPLRYRRQILYLKQHFAGLNCTVLMLDDNTGRAAGDDQIESLAHGVMSLAKTSPEYGVSRRQIYVQKIRGVKFREGNHDLLMETGGLIVFPRLVASEHHRGFARSQATSGIEGLDKLLGGGLDHGTSTVVMGPAGTGKSTLCMTFALAEAARGRRVMFFTFDETLGTLITRIKQLGLNIDSAIDSGNLKLQQVDPAEISPGELAYRIKHGVQQEGIDMIVVDSLNGYLHAMPDQRHLTLQLHELLAFLNQQGVTTLMILTQQGLVGNMQTPIDLTYLADTVILLRYFENAGTVRQAVSVIKKRSGQHERAIREYWLGAGGAKVGEPLVDFQGVLTGTPVMNKAQPKG